MFSGSCNNNLVHQLTCENHNCQQMNKMTAEIMNNNKKETPVIRNGFKKIKTVEVKKEEVLAIRGRFPNKIPVIVQRYTKERSLPNLEKCKFLVPQEITMSQFQTIIRNRMKMAPNQALYLLVSNRSMVSLSLTMAEVYKDHASNDGFLYVTYASQEVFGNEDCERTLIENNAKKSRLNFIYRNMR